jgi:hypothetical protein
MFPGYENRCGAESIAGENGGAGRTFSRFNDEEIIPAPALDACRCGA